MSIKNKKRNGSVIISLKIINRNYKIAFGLAIFTIIYNIVEGLISTYLGFEDESLVLFGFGSDSFIEVISGLGIAHVITSIYNIVTGQKPITTFWGVVISIISILVMLILVVWKRKVGQKLDSEPILADANCTMVCVYMSIILLISSGIYELTSISYIDSIGTLGLSYFAFKEGKECFEKANSEKYCACD